MEWLKQKVLVGRDWPGSKQQQQQGGSLEPSPLVSTTIQGPLQGSSSVDSVVVTQLTQLVCCGSQQLAVGQDVGTAPESHSLPDVGC